MDEQTYFSERLEDQITWYAEKSRKNKLYYNLFRVVEFLSAALIPFMVTFLTGETDLIKFAVEILAIIVVISAGLISIFRFSELWAEYRTNAESLKHEKYLYLTSAKPYDKENKFRILVERVERLISVENSRWHDHTSA